MQSVERHSTHATVSGVNGSVTSGGWIVNAKGKVSWGRKSPSGSRGEDPIGGIVDEPIKLIFILEMDAKLIFYGGKIKMHTCLVVSNTAISSIHDNRHTQDSFVCLLCPANHPYLGMVIRPSPTVNFFGGCIPLIPIADAYGNSSACDKSNIRCNLRTRRRNIFLYP